MPDSPLSPEGEVPLSVQWDDPEPASISWNPSPEKKSRARSALDAMLRNTKQVWDESVSMAAQLPSVEDAADALSAIPHGLAQSDLGAAFGPSVDFAKRGLSVLNALYHVATAGPHAAIVEPAMAAAGASEEQQQGARNVFELIGGTALGAAQMASHYAPVGSGAARKPVVDPETGQTILKNPPADEALQAAYLDELKAKGVDVTDPKAVAAHVAEREGVPPPRVEVTDTPISKTEVVKPDYSARIKQLKAEIKPLVDKGDLTEEEGKLYAAKMRELNSALYDRGITPVNPKGVQPNSTLGVEVVKQAHADLLSDKSVFEAITDAAAGTFHDSDTAVDKMAPRIYQAFAKTREALRRQYGDTITLYRAVGKQKDKATTNWATTEAYARQFGDEIVSRQVPVDDVIAVNVGNKGTYHEVIVGKPPAPEIKVQIEPGTPGEMATRVEHEVANHVPEKLGLREAPVEDNNLLTLEGLEKERATFAMPVEPGRGLPGPHVPSDVNPALEAIQGARLGADDLSRRADMVFDQTERIAGKGTIAKETREAFREAGPKPETKTLRVSEQDVETYGQKLIAAARSLKEAYRNPNLQDPTSQLGIRMAMDALETATDRWTAMRFGLGRAVGRFGKALDDALAGSSAKEAREISALLEAAGVNLEGSQLARQAYWTEGWKALVRGDGYKGISDLTKFGSMNLFSVLSFSMDAVTSFWRHSGMLGGSVTRDAYWAAKGHFNFPNLGAYWRAIKRGELPESIQRELGGTVAGEGARGASAVGEIFRQSKEAYKEGGLKHMLTEPIEVGSGVATHRSNIGSLLFDEATMGPAYLKRVVDSASGRSAARIKLSALADEAANTKGLTGDARAAFIDDFIAAPPKEAVEEITRVGHELQWNVPISEWESKMNSAAYIRWFVTAFPSWPSQFVRGFADMLGVRPATWMRIVKSGAPAAEVAEQIGKAATGWGSIMLVNSLYDHVDFDSMELTVPGSAERYRFSGVSPLPEMFAFLAATKGVTGQDQSGGMKFWAALKHANIPIVSALARQGGLFTPIANNLATLANRGTYNAVKTSRELGEMVNSLFPAQAVLGALKSVLDPVNREGIGARVPVVSEQLPPKIDTTTGEQQIQQQRIGDLRFRSISGVPIRGASRDTDAVFEMLDYYVPEAIIRSGVRTPFAGLKVSEIPEEWQNEYKEIFGKKRWELMTAKRHGALAGKFMAGQLPLEKGSRGYEKVRAKIRHLDALAARFAIREMKKRHKGGKPIRKPSILESSGAGWDYSPVEKEEEEPPPTITWDDEEPQTAPE